MYPRFTASHCHPFPRTKTMSIVQKAGSSVQFHVGLTLYTRRCSLPIVYLSCNHTLNHYAPRIFLRTSSSGGFGTLGNTRCPRHGSLNIRDARYHVWGAHHRRTTFHARVVYTRTWWKGIRSSPEESGTVQANHVGRGRTFERTLPEDQTTFMTLSNTHPHDGSGPLMGIIAWVIFALRVVVLMLTSILTERIVLGSTATNSRKRESEENILAVIRSWPDPYRVQP